jgi:hypothetical protein
MRENDIAKAYVKFADRVETWSLAPAGGRSLDDPLWMLDVLQGVNVAKPLLHVNAI